MYSTPQPTSNTIDAACLSSLPPAMVYSMNLEFKSEKIVTRKLPRNQNSFLFQFSENKAIIGEPSHIYTVDAHMCIRDLHAEQSVKCNFVHDNPKELAFQSPKKGTYFQMSNAYYHQMSVTAACLCIWWSNLQMISSTKFFPLALVLLWVGVGTRGWRRMVWDMKLCHWRWPFGSWT